MRRFRSTRLIPARNVHSTSVIRRRLDRAHSEGQYCLGWLHYFLSACSRRCGTATLASVAGPTTGGARVWDVGCVDCYDGEQTEYGLGKPQDHGVDEQLLCSGKVSWLQYIAVYCL